MSVMPFLLAGGLFVSLKRLIAPTIMALGYSVRYQPLFSSFWGAWELLADPAPSKWLFFFIPI